MGKYRYREVKNYIHNELKLTKEDIKEIMVPIVKEEVKRIFQNTYGNDVDIERWVRCMVSNEIQRHGDYSMIRNLCREIIKEEIADRLSIDISLKRKRGKICRTKFLGTIIPIMKFIIHIVIFLL